MSNVPSIFAGRSAGVGMSLGLPSHLARATNSKALAAASHSGGLVCLAAALANVIISGLTHQNDGYWLTLVALLPMAALLYLLSRNRTLALTVAYLAIGAACTYLYTVTLLSLTPSYLDTNLFVIALLVVAMTLVGGVGSGALIAVLWASLGFALAEAAVCLAAITAGREFKPDAISLGAYLLMIAVLIFDGAVRSGRGIPQSTIHRAIREDQAMHIRHELALESAAELHDNTISELVTIANSTPGPLRPALRERMEADLHQLGRDRATDPPANGAEGLSDVWLESELFAAVELVRDEGLTVEVSGKTAALGRLSEERRRALGLAVRQCLMNVLRHSGSAAADVAISASTREISVLVVDSGRGFVESETSVDRLGLRHSVHERIERVGGSVTIWSSPDVGTTVMLVVPCDSISAAEEGVSL